jgi:hypothetical protein
MVCVLALFSITRVLATKNWAVFSKLSGHSVASGLYYKNIMIVNDTYKVFRMMPQFGASLTNIIPTSIMPSFMLPEL